MFVKRGCLIVFLVLFFQEVIAQVSPEEGSTLNALYVPMQANATIKADKYTFKIAVSHHDDIQEFEKHVTIIQHSETNSLLSKVPFFNSEYTWQVVYSNHKGKKLSVSPLYHFRVLPLQVGDTSRKYRIRVLENKYQDTNLHFFLDETSAIYDLKGNAVWQLPAFVPGVQGQGAISDLKLSPFNTITFIAGNAGYEVDYKGNVLWSTPPTLPGRQINETYHHEFSRLQNGNYMILSSEVIHKRIPEGMSIPVQGRGDNPPGNNNLIIDMGTIVELDKKANVIWEWKSSEYFTDDLFFGTRTSSGQPVTRPHLNAFHFDEKNKVVYAGFRTISQVVKIKYPEKSILASYNGKSADGERVFFSRQHSINISSDNNLYIFSNNNSVNTTVRNRAVGPMELLATDRLEDSIPTIVMLSEPKAEGDTLKKVWEFDCKIDQQAVQSAFRGGNVTELTDGNMLVCMGAANRIFIVSREKEILYNAILEQWDTEREKWSPFHQYRASPVTLTQIKALAGMQ